MNNTSTAIRESTVGREISPNNYDKLPNKTKLKRIPSGKTNGAYRKSNFGHKVGLEAGCWRLAGTDLESL
jgi:hypothetical protein